MARETNASYELSDNRRSPINGISTIDLAYCSFASLEEFVTATDGTEIATKRGYSFQFRDTSGWCPLKTANQWYRCLLVKYQNPIGTAFGIDGTVILATGQYCVWLGEITGTTSFTVEWVAIKDHGVIREELPRTTATLNGHFVAGQSGYTAMTSHASGDITQQYRTQLNPGGALLAYKSTDSGANWTVLGQYMRSDDVQAWSAYTATSISATSYINSIGGSYFYYNAGIKMMYLSLNINFSACPSNGTVLLSKLPKAFGQTRFIIAQNGTTAPAARLYINNVGQLLNDGAIPATGWYSGSTTYPYSSL